MLSWWPGRDAAADRRDVLLLQDEAGAAATRGVDPLAVFAMR